MTSAPCAVRARPANPPPLRQRDSTAEAVEAHTKETAGVIQHLEFHSIRSAPCAVRGPRMDGGGRPQSAELYINAVIKVITKKKVFNNGGC